MCENWLLTLIENHGFGIFEKRVLERIFLCKMELVIVGRKKL
jgi:hypothetical protein